MVTGSAEQVQVLHITNVIATKIIGDANVGVQISVMGQKEVPVYMGIVSPRRAHQVIFATAITDGMEHNVPTQPSTHVHHSLPLGFGRRNGKL